MRLGNPWRLDQAVLQILFIEFVDLELFACRAMHQVSFDSQPVAK